MLTIQENVKQKERLNDGEWLGQVVLQGQKTYE
jgi:hypothetical protein